MRLIDEQFTKRPFYGARKMTAFLRASGHPVNRKRVRRLMRVMGLVAIYPKPRLSAGGPDHKVYPYLLKGVTIDGAGPSVVRGCDLYSAGPWVRLSGGRHGLAQPLYPVLGALDDIGEGVLFGCLGSGSSDREAGIFNTDQGPQFTSEEFTALLEGEGIQVSMDGRGRVYDNIFVERLWRTVKYEEVYLHEYRTVIPPIPGPGGCCCVVCCVLVCGIGSPMTTLSPSFNSPLTTSFTSV